MLGAMRWWIAIGAALLVACEPSTSSLDAAVPDAGALPAPPATLSEAGLFANGIDGALAEGVRPYDVRHPLWTDGLEKRRFLWLPPGSSIDVSDPDHWSFPVGTRLYKSFSLAGRTLETRLLWKVRPDAWVYVSYVHRADGTDADASPSGLADVAGTFHDVPSQTDCRNCHRGGGDFVLGVGAYQLDRATFDAWRDAGVLPDDAPHAEVPGTDVERAPLGYLHGNCGHCHGERHPLSAQRTLRLHLPVGLTDASEAPAWRTTVGALAHHDIGGTTMLVVAGDPEASQLYVRASLRDPLAMPPLSTERIDMAALEALAAWIAR